ncbi:ubiquitin-conjugating enzyme E2 W [Thoreauomyces humboldtii]|nr:ubiquitin-conjugating enzyme E2 W [Thoreauomyces humboldtii]
MSNIFTKRLTKELRDLQANPPAGISIDTAADDLKSWKVALRGAEGTLYAGEIFKLQFKFSNNYPLESPEVIFVENVPVHPHIYSTHHQLRVSFDTKHAELLCQKGIAAR